jgi:hypothetical protein
VALEWATLSVFGPLALLPSHDGSLRGFGIAEGIELGARLGTLRIGLLPKWRHTALADGEAKRSHPELTKQVQRPAAACVASGVRILCRFIE